METLYILDDDKEFTDEVKESLDEKSFTPYRIFNDVDEFKKCITPNMFAAVIDFFMPKLNGMEVIGLIKKIQPDCLSIVVSESQYDQLPNTIHNFKYVKFVCKQDRDYINQIITLTKNHFKMILEEYAFKKRVMSS